MSLPILKWLNGKVDRNDMLERPIKKNSSLRHTNFLVRVSLKKIAKYRKKNLSHYSFGEISESYEIRIYDININSLYHGLLV